MEAILLIAFFVIVAWGSWFLNSPSFKGAIGERRVNSSLLKHLPEEYHVFADLTLPSLGGTTQIDHVVVSRFGVFVIETKNMQGWIFGDANQAKWTQTIYGHKTRFQNPLRQNFKHVKAIQEAVGVNLNCIHNLVVFAGSAEPRTLMPENVSWDTEELLEHIFSHEDVFFDENEVAAISARLSEGDFETNRKDRRLHIGNVEQAINSCPKCGSTLVLRINKRAGTKFLGCERFPNCRGTRPFH